MKKMLAMLKPKKVRNTYFDYYCDLHIYKYRYKYIYKQQLPLSLLLPLLLSPPTTNNKKQYYDRIRINKEAIEIDYNIYNYGCYYYYM